jgi:hypothetical protein
VSIIPGKVEKKSTSIIGMSKILEKILTEKSARSDEETEAIAVAQNEFLSWG